MGLMDIKGRIPKNTDDHRTFVTSVSNYEL